MSYTAHASRAVLLASLFFLVVSATVAAQQSTTGPIPPPGIDRGLRAPNRTQVIIPDVPAYYWEHGCGPTALGMVIGYWDGQGFPELVEGDATWQTPEVDAMIADDSGQPDCDLPDGDHYQDYSCPLDSSPGPLLEDLSELGGAHTSNCIADFMRTSWSSWYNYYGWSWDEHVAPAFTAYVQLVSDYAATADLWSFQAFRWTVYKSEIDAGRPVVLLVDTDGDNWTDHFVTAIGYDDATQEYAILDTWDLDVHWYLWQGMDQGVPWGVYSAVTCNLMHPSAACCIDDVCEIMTEQDCIDAGGVWQVGVPNCDPNPCGSSGIAHEPTQRRTGAWIRAVPNPLCADTQIRFATGTSAGHNAVSLRVFDLTGRQIRLLMTEAGSDGRHVTVWDARDDTGQLVASGMYLLRLTTETWRLDHRVCVIR